MLMEASCRSTSRRRRFEEACDERFELDWLIDSVFLPTLGLVMADVATLELILLAAATLTYSLGLSMDY